MLHLLTSALAFGSSTKPPPPGPAPAKGEIARICDCKIGDDKWKKWNITSVVNTSSTNKLVHISSLDNRCLALGPGPPSAPYIYSAAMLVDCDASYPPAQFFEWKIDPDNMQIQFGMDKTLCLASFPMDNKELGAAKCEDKRFNSYLKTDPNGQDQGIYRIVADNQETSCATVTAFPNCTEPVI